MPAVLKASTGRSSVLPRFLWYADCIDRSCAFLQVVDLCGQSYRKGQSAVLKNDDKPIANPVVMLREEFDDWAVLFNVDTCHGSGLNPTGVFVWKLLTGSTP